MRPILLSLKLRSKRKAFLRGEANWWPLVVMSWSMLTPDEVFLTTSAGKMSGVFWKQESNSWPPVCSSGEIPTCNSSLWSSELLESLRKTRALFMMGFLTAVNRVLSEEVGNRYSFLLALKGYLAYIVRCGGHVGNVHRLASFVDLSVVDSSSLILMRMRVPASNFLVPNTTWANILQQA